MPCDLRCAKTGFRSLVKHQGTDESPKGRAENL